MSSEQKRVLLIENDGGMIRSVKDAIDADPRLRFIGYLTGRTDLDSFLDVHAPDVALVDIGLMRPGEGMHMRVDEQSFDEGLWIVGRISDKSPHTKIIGFSNYFIHLDHLVKDALERGADAVIAKQSGPPDWPAWTTWLCSQVHAVLDGWWRMSPEVARLLSAEEDRRRATDSITLPLTDRQAEVLKLLARGWSNAQIAEALVIEEGAVRGHISNIKKRLQMEHRWELIQEARRRGMGGKPPPAT